MKSTKIYKKVGRRYIEIGNFDNESLFYPHGASLVFSRKGGTLTRFGIEPADAAVIAALQRVKETVVNEMEEAAKMMPEKRPYTKKELKAIQAMRDVLGDSGMMSIRFEGVSMSGIVERGLEIVKKEILG